MVSQLGIASYSGPSHPAKQAWFSLFAHVCNLTEILVNCGLPCFVLFLFLLWGGGGGGVIQVHVATLYTHTQERLLKISPNNFFFDIPQTLRTAA